jgi:hypothetical protein
MECQWPVTFWVYQEKPLAVGTTLRFGGIASQASADRLISLGDDLARIPERLLLAHARGEVLFLVGAGVSRSSGLPDFRGLVKKIFEQFDLPVHAFLEKPRNPGDLHSDLLRSTLTDQQRAEVKRFLAGDFDVVLGMLERRIEGLTPTSSDIRLAIANALRGARVKPAPIHRSLMRLSNRGVATTVVTTNFEFLLEEAARSIGVKAPTYSLGGIPRPGLRRDFSGVLHIHGAIDRDQTRAGDLIVSDHDFGEFYLRRRVVPDFIYDAARLFNIVLVGYSANDPPMRYLLNAVAADGTRFSDLKERFTFIGADAPDPILMEDWRGRGITPIEYDSVNGHAALASTLAQWAALSAITGKQSSVDAIVKRAVKTKRAAADDATRDLFDHLIRRSDPVERIRLSAVASDGGADLEWLDAIMAVASEVDGSSP